MTETVAASSARPTSFDALVADLAPSEWRRDTPPAGWTIAHQIAHLAWTDEIALLAATDPASFGAQLNWLPRTHTRVGWSTRQPSRARMSIPPRRWHAGVRRGPPLRRRSDCRPTRSVRLPWFRAADDAASMGHGASDGDLGPRPRRRRWPRQHPVLTERLRDIAHLGVPHPQLCVCRERPPRAGGRVPHLSWTAPGGELWAGGPDAGRR